MLPVISAIARQLLSTIFFNSLFILIYIAVLIFVKKKLERQTELIENTTGIQGKNTREMIE